METFYGLMGIGLVGGLIVLFVILRKPSTPGPTTKPPIVGPEPTPITEQALLFKRFGYPFYLQSAIHWKAMATFDARYQEHGCDAAGQIDAYGIKILNPDAEVQFRWIFKGPVDHDGAENYYPVYDNKGVQLGTAGEPVWTNSNLVQVFMHGSRPPYPVGPMGAGCPTTPPPPITDFTKEQKSTVHARMEIRARLKASDDWQDDGVSWQFPIYLIDCSS